MDSRRERDRAAEGVEVAKTAEEVEGVEEVDQVGREGVQEVGRGEEVRKLGRGTAALWRLTCRRALVFQKLANRISAKNTFEYILNS